MKQQLSPLFSGSLFLLEINSVCCILVYCSVTVPDLQLHWRRITGVMEIIHRVNVSFCEVQGRFPTLPHPPDWNHWLLVLVLSLFLVQTFLQQLSSAPAVTLPWLLPFSRWHSSWVSEPQPEDCSAAFPTFLIPYSVKVCLELAEQPTLILEYGIGEAKAGTSCVTKIRTWAQAVRAQAAWTGAIVLKCSVCWLCFQWADGEMESSPCE